MSSRHLSFAKERRKRCSCSSPTTVTEELKGLSMVWNWVQREADAGVILLPSWEPGYSLNASIFWHVARGSNCVLWVALMKGLTLPGGLFILSFSNLFNCTHSNAATLFCGLRRSINIFNEGDISSEPEVLVTGVTHFRFVPCLLSVLREEWLWSLPFKVVWTLESFHRIPEETDAT